RIAEQYLSINTCSTCQGFRLRPEALSVKINNKHIGEITKLSVVEAISWCQALLSQLTGQQRDISQKLLDEIIRRLTFLKNVGLGYLTLSRESGTLSGGEGQRINNGKCRLYNRHGPRSRTKWRTCNSKWNTKRYTQQYQ
ncbi:excinuclease ABC subunit A, partial [Ehrlichia ruminantium]